MHIAEAFEQTWQTFTLFCYQQYARSIKHSQGIFMTLPNFDQYS